MHGKNYRNQFEEIFRMKVFIDNKKKIDEHNAKYELGEASYKMKMNHLGDLVRKLLCTSNKLVNY